MSEEEKYKKAINELADSYELHLKQWAKRCIDTINEYTTNLQQELQQKENIIKEVREDLDKQITFCTNEADGTTNDKYCRIAIQYLKHLRQILDKNITKKPERVSEEDINFLISIQDLEQPEFDNVYLERENENLRYPNLIKSYQKENKELKIKLLEEQLKNEKLDRRII